MTNQRFEALSRICLNNWHYIKQKTLSFHDGINFFTGHSGSGKSTVIDALQIILYANTDGRGFFNKAAADDSDRSLLEYLRGMVNIGENNEFSYLRNQNFSSTIVLELKQTDTEECQCVGVVFDVETATNEINRMFFMHKGPLPSHEYRTELRCMSTDEVRDYLQRNYSKEECFYGSNNERFRKQLYDIYLGGLDQEKFPQLFKRAIPFKMNIKLEEFVKEYICMEQDIHIDDMQESVMQYGRMRKKIEDTYAEIQNLQRIKKQFEEVLKAEDEKTRYAYYVEKVDLLQKQQRVNEQMQKIQLTEEDLGKQRISEKNLLDEVNELTEQNEELLKQISASGYEELMGSLSALNELIERLNLNKGNWMKVAERLNEWKDKDITSNQTSWDIEEFVEASISEDTLKRLQHNLHGMREEIQQQRGEVNTLLHQLKNNEKQIKEELEQLKSGGKAYPKEIETARTILQKRLSEKLGKVIQVDILADLLDIRDDHWRNAVEGYMGNNKLSLIVEPKYAKTAMEIYQELDKEKFYRVAVLDTEKVSQDTHTVVQGALAEEVMVNASYLQAYIDFLLGKVMKCNDIEELRKCKIGITADGMLYHSYRIQHINPDNYTKSAYIGRNSIRNRIKLLEINLASILEERKPQEVIIKECDQILALESLQNDVETYKLWQKDMHDLKEKQKEQKKLKDKIEKLKESNVDELVKERKEILERCEIKKGKLQNIQNNIVLEAERLVQEKETAINLNEELTQKEKVFERKDDLEEELHRILSNQSNPRYDRLKMNYLDKLNESDKNRDQVSQVLLDTRVTYLRHYPNRNYSPTAKDNKQYEDLLNSLQFDQLEEYRKIATEQARAAVEHFKDDFMFKIRSAIREALQRKDELNRIISKLDFGKDKYQFVIGKNKGPDGKFYDMFMDESLEVNPSQLNISMDNQMDLFTMEHESSYGEMINDLINIFIPPDTETSEQLEEAKRNMDKYADYRTYLSFDMQQLIQNEDQTTLKIGLSKMIKKNSGGEGQNPLYVALLASFAQAYRINLSPKIQRNPTIRLVVLDEAFSKMDAEKVASCIELIRGLGFQALISATNDKIQNYIENVDKIFVYANPNKKCISIQEFEKIDFNQLARDLNEDEDTN
jgi:uncharacterized protein YPO0396